MKRAFTITQNSIKSRLYNHDSYNSAGMLVKDRDKGINRITYNNIGLVDSIFFDNGARIAYVYSMTGEKLKVAHWTAMASTASATMAGTGDVLVPLLPRNTKTTEYIGGDIEAESQSLIYGSAYKYHFGNGYVRFYPGSTQIPLYYYLYYYYTADHLGNIRSVVTKNPNANEIDEVQQTAYYPFGGIIADLGTGRSVQNHLYNGKELDYSNNLWWYDYGARQYDPAAPRFTTPDPLAEKYFPWNYYTYCVNNPILFLDPDGREIDLSNMSEEERVKFMRMMDTLRQSELFDRLYKELEESPTIFSVSFWDKIEDLFNANGYYEEKTNSISLMPDAGGGSYAEEMFHAYQFEHKDNYFNWNNYNKEWEAKVYRKMVAKQAYFVAHEDENTYYMPWIELSQLNKADYYTADFQNEYFRNGPYFAEFYKSSKNQDYRSTNFLLPMSLIHLLTVTR